MKIYVVRLCDDGDTSLGALYIDGVLACGTVEDEERFKKVYGETRIPDGVYNLGLRAEGGFHNRYLKRFGSNFHKGMLCIYNKDNWIIEKDGMKFQYVLLHVGNDDDDTDACVLLNYVLDFKNYKGATSVLAYKRVYKQIIKALLSGDSVKIEFKSIYKNEKDSGFIDGEYC